MSEAIETTFSGATRAFFGSLGFILLMLGLEMVTGKEGGLQLGLGAFLILAGAACFYLAVAWNSLRRHVVPETQETIGNFAKSRAVWLGLAAVFFLTLIFSPFIEQRRWPFSYPADPSVLAENDQLKKLETSNQQDAAKWRFAYYLRYEPRSENNGMITCKFSLILSPGDAAWNTWRAVQPMLELAHWDNLALPNQSRSEVPFQRIDVLSGDNKEAASCAAALGKAIGGAFPQLSVSVRASQTSPTLVSCKNECVELDVGN